MRKLILLMVICSVGCSGLIVKTPKVVLLPEERIFTVPAGQEITVQYDKIEQTLTFPQDMKLVSATTLVRQEENLNKKALATVKASENKLKKYQILLYGLMGLAAILGIFFKAKKWFPKSLKANVEVK